ncbi:unnamed protein product, partial [Nesidiocoris tenuis]
RSRKTLEVRATSAKRTTWTAKWEAEVHTMTTEGHNEVADIRITLAVVVAVPAIISASTIVGMTG